MPITRRRGARRFALAAALLLTLPGSAAPLPAEASPGRVLAGHDGADRLVGGPARDRLLGHAGSDRLAGGRGNDRLSGGRGRDHLSGGRGRDRLSGGSGRDRLVGGPGADVLDCGPGRDRALAGPGDVVRNCETAAGRRTRTPARPPAPVRAPEDTSVPLRTARSAASFVDSIGVNVHMNYDGSQYYENAPRLARELKAIGVRHVRDGHQGRRQDQFDRLNLLADAGLGITLIEDPRSDPHIAGDTPVRRWDDPNDGGRTPEDPRRWGRLSLEERIRELRAGKIRNVVALEGPNEYDTMRDFGDYQWVPTVKRFQCHLKALRDAHLRRLELIGPSETNWQAYQAIRDGGIAPCAPIGNLHPYPNDNPPVSSAGWWRPDWAGSLAWHVTEIVERYVPGRAGAPWVASETGYHNAMADPSGHRPVPEDVGGVYAPKLFLEYFRQGAKRTFWYEAVDQWPNPARDWHQNHFGLLRNDFSWKPAARNLRNLIASVSRPGRTTTGRLRYALENAPEDLQQLLLRRGDGSYALALWRDARVWDGAAKRRLDPGAATVTLRLGTVADVERYVIGARPAPARVRAKSLAMQVPAGDTVVLGIR